MLRLKQLLHRHWPSFILAAVLVALILNSLFGRHGPRDLLLLRHHRAELEARRTALAARNRQLETIVQNLRSNRRYLERRIRSELGWVRPDELIYKFTAPGAPSTPAARAARKARGR